MTHQIPLLPVGYQSSSKHVRGLIVRYPRLLNFTDVLVFLSAEIYFGTVRHQVKNKIQSDTRRNEWMSQKLRPKTKNLRSKT